MKEKEVLMKHYLKVLVELDLYFKIKLLGEGTKIQNIDTARKETIDNFLENLPLQYKGLSDYQDIVYDTLNKLERRDKAYKEKDEEER